MPTRSDLLALPPAELARLADPALRASADRYGWRPMRAAGLPASLLVEVVLAAQLRAASEAASHERAVGSQSTHEQR